MGDVVVLATFVPRDSRCPKCARLPPSPSLTFQGQPGMKIDYARINWEYTCTCGTECETQTEFGEST